jgi:hypothetical protein
MVSALQVKVTDESKLFSIDYFDALPSGVHSMMIFKYFCPRPLVLVFLYYSAKLVVE